MADIRIKRDDIKKEAEKREHKDTDDTDDSCECCDDASCTCNGLCKWNDD